MTPAEKLDEIMKVLEKIMTNWTLTPRDDAARCYTLAKELRENAVDGYTGMGSTGLEFAPRDESFTPGPASTPALLILSEHKP